jgi:predicted transcriptional regulator
MDIKATKLELMQLLLQTKKESVLKKMKALFDEANQENDWWDKLTPDDKKAIENGIKQAENGELVPHDDAMNIFKKWL